MQLFILLISEPGVCGFAEPCITLLQQYFTLQIERTVSPNRPSIAGNEAEGREKTTTTTRTKEVHGNLLQVIFLKGQFLID